MFNFFKNNNDNEKENKPEQSEEVKELIQRWDAFLKKIEDRFVDAIEQAKEALLEQLEASDYDYNATLRAWQAMKGKIMNITEQIDHTWDTKVKPKMEPLGDFHYDEGFKGDDLNDKLSHDIHLYSIEVEGVIAEAFYAHAVKTIDKEFLCTQCNSPLSIKKDVFRMHYVVCEYCTTTNTYEPHVKYNQIGWYAVDAMVEKALLEEYRILHESERKISETRPPLAEDLIEAHKKAFWNYHHKRLDARIAYKSDEAERKEKDIERLERDLLDYIGRQNT